MKQIGTIKIYTGSPPASPDDDVEAEPIRVIRQYESKTRASLRSVTTRKGK